MKSAWTFIFLHTQFSGSLGVAYVMSNVCKLYWRPFHLCGHLSCCWLQTSPFNRTYRTSILSSWPFHLGQRTHILVSLCPSFLFSYVVSIQLNSLKTPCDRCCLWHVDLKLQCPDLSCRLASHKAIWLIGVASSWGLNGLGSLLWGFDEVWCLLNITGDMMPQF